MYPARKTILAACVAALFFSSMTQAQEAPPTPRQGDTPQHQSAAGGVPELRAMANKAYSDKDHAGFRDAMMQLHDLRPNNSEYMYQLVLAHALLDEKRAAYNMMLQMQRQGLHYDFNSTPDSENIRNTEVYDFLNSLMVDAGTPLGVLESTIEIPTDFRLPEAIARDETRGAFLVGTVSGGEILALGGDGTMQTLIAADQSSGFWGIYGLAVDQQRNRLWATSAATPAFKHFDDIDRGRSVLLEFELDSLELLHRYPVPVDGRPHSLGNIVLAPNGDLFMADSLIPLVYQLESGEDRLKPFLGAREMVNLRGIDISEDGRLLYIADYEMGITVVDLEEKVAAQLAAPDTLNLGGIDGLSYWKGHLIVIQNGIRPERVLRLTLDRSRTRVEQVAVLAVSHELFEAPTYGVVVDDDFYFFANSHWAATEIRPVTIARARLDQAPMVADPNIERLRKQIERKKERTPETDSENPGTP